MAEQHTHLAVTGITCANCAANIERSVKKLAGVEDARAIHLKTMALRPKIFVMMADPDQFNGFWQFKPLIIIGGWEDDQPYSDCF
jgi:hypothetical protein